MRIYTGSYEKCRVPQAILIPPNREKGTLIEGNSLKSLAPKKPTIKRWNDKLGQIDEDKNIELYVTSYYKTVLKETSPGEILCSLQEGSILVSGEGPNEFSPRLIVAAWLELFYNLEIREVIIAEDGTVQRLPRNKHYKTIKTLLESLIKADMDMKGHKSIAVVYAYQRAEHLQNNPDIESRLGIPAEMYFRIAETLERRLESEEKTI